MDLDATPLPRSRPRSIASSITASEASSRSKTSSAKKQMMNLKRSDGGGIKYELLRPETVPQVAKPFFIDMAKIERGVNTIPYALRETIRGDQGLTPEDFKQIWPDDCFQSKNDADNLPGRILSFALIKQTLARAKECEICKQDEAGWNGMVHFPLLRNIFEDNFGKQYDNITARSW